MDHVRFGILGYASIARKHVIPAILKAANAIPYAIASRHEEKLAEAKANFGFEKTYGSYAELLDDSDVNAVYIPLPNRLHREWVIRAANAGKHILCEKPLGLDGDECREMQEAARRGGVLLMEAYMYRFTPRMQVLRDLLEQGSVGRIRHITTSFRYRMREGANIRREAGLGGGSLRDVGCYPVNLLSMLLGAEPLSFHVQRVDIGGVDHSLSAVLRYPGDVIASLHCGFDSQSCQLTEINGEEGTLLIRDTFLGTDTPILLYRDGVETVIPVAACERYLLEVEAFCGAVLSGAASPLDGKESIRNNRLISQLLAAGDENQEKGED